jgi:VWFA-related protein
MDVMTYGLRGKFLVPLIIFVLSIPYLSGQSKKAQPGQKPAQHDAAAVIKLVTVRVVDQAGRPVTDLRKEDFILYDNAELQAITEFEVHALSELGMTIRQPGRPAELVDAEQGMNRRLFMFFDLQGCDIFGVANAKKAALNFLDNQLCPGDEVGILGFSPMRGFFIRTYLTTDYQKIRRAIKRTKELPPSQGEMFMGVFVPGSSMFARADFVPRMSELANAMQYIPGNKSLILFTGRNLGSAYSGLGKLFASAGTPVYTVNTQNWIRHSILSLSIKRKFIWTEHPLQEMSLASGGKYFADIKDVNTISRDIQFLTGNYYVLGYYVTEAWDGKYHQIQVAVKRLGLTVLAQDGYFNPKPFSQLSDFEKQLHLQDLAFSDKSTGLDPLDVPIEPLFIAGRKDVNCAVLGRMTVSEKTGVSPAKVEIFAFLFNTKGKLIKQNRGVMDFAPFDQTTFFPYFLAKLPQEEYECRVVARDLETGQASVGKTIFALPNLKGMEFVISSPILFVPGTESQLLRLSEASDRKGNPKGMSLGDIYGFSPRNHSLVVRELERGPTTLLAALPVTFSGNLAPDAEFTARLISVPARDAVDLKTEVIDFQETGNQSEVYMLEIFLPELPTGEYTLELEARDRNTHARSMARKTLMIR